MNLIIRTTGLCNFDCSFCSAGSLNIAHPIKGVPDQIKDVIKTIKPSSIILSGGEPLLVGPDYFLELYEISKVQISATSNLKDFYNDPDKWKEVFNHPHIGMVTSFNYGDSRKWDPNTVYTEDMFVDIFYKFLSMTGRRLPFIAVIDEHNEHLALNHVKLARRLDTVVRINNALKQGRQGSTYPRYKMFQIYIDIVEAGLREHEVNCNTDILSRCPMNTDFLCKSCIRTCYVDKDNILHYYDCCEAMEEHLLDYKNDYNLPTSVYPPRLQHVNKNCAMCELFSLCNACDSQQAQYPPEHCMEMRKMKDRLIKYGWAKEF